MKSFPLTFNDSSRQTAHMWAKPHCTECECVCIYELICSLQSWVPCSAFIARHFLCVLHIWQNSYGICKQKPNEIEIGTVGKQRQIIKLNFAFELFALFVLLFAVYQKLLIIIAGCNNDAINKQKTHRNQWRILSFHKR